MQSMSEIRSSKLQRKTAETDITLSLLLDAKLTTDNIRYDKFS